MAQIKNLYLGKFNMAHQIYIERVMAYSTYQAWLLLCKRIAKKRDEYPQMVMNYFPFEKSLNYEIKTEIEWSEEEEK